MATISDRQIAISASLALSGSQDKVPIATAIALAESGGNTTAHNTKPPDDSYGLWQINMYGSLGPSRRKSLGISSNEQLYDPLINAKAMASISSDGTNWNPWSMYKNGKYKQFLNRAEIAAKDITGSTNDLSISERLSDIANDPFAAFTGIFQSLIAPITQFVGVFIDLAKWIGNPANWIRVIQVIAGVGLAGIAANITLKPYISSAVKTVKGG